MLWVPIMEHEPLGRLLAHPAHPSCSDTEHCWPNVFPMRQNISVSLSVIALVALIGAGVGVGSGIGE